MAFAAQISEIRAGLAEGGWQNEMPARVVVFGGDEDGFLREVEVAIDPS